MPGLGGNSGDQNKHEPCFHGASSPKLRKKEEVKQGNVHWSLFPLPSKQADSIVKHECPSVMVKKPRAILYMADTVLPV